MRKALSTGLLFILLLQSGGMLIFYQLRQNLHRIKMSEKKDSAHRLEKFVLSVEEFNKIRVGRDEMLYDGKMYDFRSVRQVGGLVEILAEHDSDEDGILRQIRELLSFSGQRQQDHLPRVLTMFFSLVLEPPMEACRLFLPVSIMMPFLYNDDRFIAFITEIPSPPPRLVNLF